jgi:hypothetical protein
VGGGALPGALFHAICKAVKTTSIDAAYDSTKFYEAWRAVIQRYGIYNTYTSRGAIKGQSKLNSITRQSPKFEFQRSLKVDHTLKRLKNVLCKTPGVATIKSRSV